MLGRKLSHNKISKANKDLTDSIEQWRSSDLSKEMIKFLFTDGVNFKMREEDSVDNAQF